jgi:hypothetical protein
MKVNPTTNLGYMFGLGGRRRIPSEPGGSTGATFRGSGRRMAGDVFPLGLLEPGYVPEPYVPELLVRDFDFSLSDESDF